MKDLRTLARDRHVYGTEHSGKHFVGKKFKGRLTLTRLAKRKILTLGNLGRCTEEVRNEQVLSDIFS